MKTEATRTKNLGEGSQKLNMEWASSIISFDLFRFLMVVCICNHGNIEPLVYQKDSHIKYRQGKTGSLEHHDYKIKKNVITTK